MASNLLSRMIPPGNQSVYEALLEDDNRSDGTDIEERAGMSADEDNRRAQDTALDSALGAAMGEEISAAGRFSDRGTPSAGLETRGQGRQKTTRPVPDDADDDVPMSLLVEVNQPGPSKSSRPRRDEHDGSPSPVPLAGQPTASTRANWSRTRQQQKLHREPHVPPRYNASSRRNPGIIADPREKALWRWANVQNLDNFLQDVYGYYLGNGIWSIILSRILNLLTTAFVVTFSVFLTSCINYKELPRQSKLADIIVPKCTQRLSGSWNLLIWLCVFLWIAKLVQYLFDIRRLKHMHDFYHHLLEIPDTDIQTVSWQEVVKRLMALRDLNLTTAAQVPERHRRFLGGQSKQRMDAHDIANRLMRRDNYLIALFNKEVLDITLPLPLVGTRALFSKTLEWNLSFCIMDFVFNQEGQVRPLFLKDSQRKALSEGLRRRFLFAGVMNIICAPFIIVYLSVFYFFRYFNEYQKNPSSISLRQYTPLAEWRFREFNELWHLFERRLNMSYPFASRYINQFPKDKTIQVARFVAFVSGALAAVLALISLVDPDLFLGFEITPERTVLFYLGVFGAVWAFANGTVPEENLVFDPEYALTAVVNYTHYLPSQWRGRLHSDEVRREFVGLYQLKLVLFLEELLSIISTPFILWFSLPKCSDRIVDFFREFTVHVDGLGYVCSFAVFDFEKGGNNMQRQKQRPVDGEGDLREDYFSTKDGKMLASYYNFVDNYVTNPKQGGQANMQGRQFFPPPAFPGLMTSNIADAPTPSQRFDLPDRNRSASRYGASGPSLAQRTPRFAPIGTQGSPITSILLDPQHQPSYGNSRHPSRPTAQSRLRNSRLPPTDLIEDDEEEELTEGGEPAASAASEGADEFEQLGESWKTTKAGNVDSDDEGASAAPPSATDKGPGVLGMVYQFSKAQTDARAGGVQI